MLQLTEHETRNIGRHQKATPPCLHPQAPVQQPCRLFERKNIRQWRMVAALCCRNEYPAAPIGTPAHRIRKTVPCRQHPQCRQQRANHYSHTIHCPFDVTGSRTFNWIGYKTHYLLEPLARRLADNQHEARNPRPGSMGQLNLEKAVRPRQTRETTLMGPGLIMIPASPSG